MPSEWKQKLIFIVTFILSQAQKASSVDANYASAADYSFRIFACGVYGGAFTADLTSFLIASAHDQYNFLAMDMGTSFDCLQTAEQNKQLAVILDNESWSASTVTTTEIGYFRKSQLNAFLITHSHLDHNGGLMISAADDSFAPKAIISRPIVIDAFLQSFRAPLWVDYTIFNYFNLSISESTTSLTALAGVGFAHFSVRTFALAHTVPSTAFLLCDENHGLASAMPCVLFFGDTGPDLVEGTDHLHYVWTSVAPYILNGSLTTMFIECSYASSQADGSLFGHLTPRWLLYELSELASIVSESLNLSSVEDVLSGVTVVVIHMKPTFVQDVDVFAVIRDELINPRNISHANLGMHFLFPQSTDLIYVQTGKLTAIESALDADEEQSSSNVGRRSKAGRVWQFADSFYDAGNFGIVVAYIAIGYLLGFISAWIASKALSARQKKSAAE